MGWNFETDQFESPLFATVPFGFLCENAKELFLAEQARLFTWWNNYWAAKMRCSLKDLSEDQCKIGLSSVANTRALYFFPTGERQKKDNFRVDKVGFGIAYTTGRTQGDGTQAGKYNHLNEASFYLEALYSLYDTAPTNKLLAGFPDIPGVDTPEARQFTASILDPTARIAALEAIGVQAYLSLEFVISPTPIYQ